jgi:hypothetical protein
MSLRVFPEAINEVRTYPECPRGWGLDGIKVRKEKVS